MKNHLSILRDEAKGLINGRKPEDLQAQASDSDSDSDGDDDDQSGHKDERDENLTANRSETADPNTSGQPQRREPASSPPPHPLTSAPDHNGVPDEDFNIDAMLREEEEQRLSSAVPAPAVPSVDPPQTNPSHAHESPQTRPSTHKPASPTDNDEGAAMWDAFDVSEFDEAFVPAPRAVSGPEAGGGGGDEADEDMWDVVREMEMEQAQPETRVPPDQSKPPENGVSIAAPLSGVENGPEEDTSSASVPPPVADQGQAEKGRLQVPQDERKATNDEGWDEMYL
jgi:replication fork protection complex subunit Csm3/Swi3